MSLDSSLVRYLLVQLAFAWDERAAIAMRKLQWILYLTPWIWDACGFPLNLFWAWWLDESSASENISGVIPRRNCTKRVYFRLCDSHNPTHTHTHMRIDIISIYFLYFAKYSRFKPKKITISGLLQLAQRSNHLLIIACNWWVMVCGLRLGCCWLMSGVLPTAKSRKQTQQRIGLRLRYVALCYC